MFRDPKMRRWLWTALGVVALAAVVFVGGALSRPADGPSVPATRLSPETEGADLARQAEDALSRNETDTALTLAQRALKADPENTQASSVIARAATSQASGGSDASSDDEADEPAEDPDEAYRERVEDLTSLLPARVSGWSAGQVVDTKADVIVTYDPPSGTALDQQVERAVFNAHDMKSESKARSFVKNVDQVTYPQHSDTVRVGVVKDGYFGTDGANSVMVAFARGRFAFEMLLVLEQGVDPLTMKKDAVALAAAFPAAK